MAMITRHKINEKWLCIGAVIALLMVCLPRFNGNTSWVKQTPYDAQYFNAYVSYFRGEIPETPIRPMSNSRFLLPLLAAALPFSAPSSLNILNLAYWAGSICLLYYILKHLKAEPKQRWWAIYLSIFSFPSFYYTCISYVDPGAIFFVFLGVFAWIKQQYWHFGAAVLLGLMAKETSIVLFPFAMAWSLQQKNYRYLFFLFFGLILFIFLHYLIRLYAPLSLGEMRFKPWQFNWGAMQNNMNRINTLLSLVLSIGIPGVLLIQKWVQGEIHWRKQASHAAALGGMFGIFALYVFSFLTTVADGRIIWHAYIFMFLIIFAPSTINYKGTKEQRKS